MGWRKGKGQYRDKRKGNGRKGKKKKKKKWCKERQRGKTRE